MTVRRRVLCAILAGILLPTTESWPQTIAKADFSSILDVCEATTLAEAMARGTRLGWPTVLEDRDWRTSFERYNGGTVQVVGWRRDEREGDGLLSFWVATGPNAHTACVLSTDRPGLSDALRDRFGAPEKSEEHGGIISAFWRHHGAEVHFTRVGINSNLNLSRR